MLARVNVAQFKFCSIDYDNVDSSNMYSSVIVVLFFFAYCFDTAILLLLPWGLLGSVIKSV